MSRAPFDGTLGPRRQASARDEQFRLVEPDSRSDSIRTFDLAPSAAGDITIQHGLGRVPQDWRVESMRDAFVSVFEVLRDSKKIVLSCSGAARFTLRVW